MKIRPEDIDSEDHDHFQGRRHPSRETRRPERRFRERAADDAKFEHTPASYVDDTPTLILKEPIPMPTQERLTPQTPSHLPTRKEPTTMKTNNESCVTQVLSLPVTPESFLFLDALIEQERARYATERLDFHDYFWADTVRDILRNLRRGEDVSGRDREEWSQTVVTLIEAHEQSPHDLWTLFLVAALSRPILRCRALLGSPENGSARTLDGVVWRAFFETLETYPRNTTFEELPAIFIGSFRRTAMNGALAIEARRQARGAPPRVGLRVVVDLGENDCEVGAPTERGS
jgi:hypothetical protein